MARAACTERAHMTAVLQLVADLPTRGELPPYTLTDKDRAKIYDLHVLSEASCKALRADWKIYTTWCAEVGRQALPASVETIVEFCAAMCAQKKIGTIVRYRATIARHHTITGFDDPTSDSLSVYEFVKLRKAYGSRREPKAPLTLDNLRAMLDACPPDLVGIRDRAILAVGFMGAFRRATLSRVEVRHLRWEKAPDGTLTGLSIYIPWEKNDKNANGRTLGITVASNPAHCPVRLLRAWLDAAGILTGPVFRRLDMVALRANGGHLPTQAIDDELVADVVKRAAQRVGLDPSLYAAHSLRRGFITEAINMDKPAHRIMAQSGHRSKTVMMQYYDDAELFKQNAGLGML